MKSLVELSPYLKNVKKPIKKATTFSRELNNRSRKKKYVKEEINMKNIHHGQRKLLLSEIEFLTVEYDIWKNKKDIILLVKITHLMSLKNLYYTVWDLGTHG